MKKTGTKPGRNKKIGTPCQFDNEIITQTDEKFNNTV